MQLGRIKGSVTATVKHSVYNSEKILIIQPLDDKLKSNGSSVLGIDKVQAGLGDIVLYVDEGNSARMILDDNTAPVRTVIMAIVDSVDIEL